MSTARTLKVAVDIGGTFTDICILDEITGRLEVAKTSSTPEDPMQGALRGLREAGVSLDAVNLFSHGTTVATNALITRRMPRSAMICTKGFRDVLEIRRADREDVWDTYKDAASPYIRRRDRLSVSERMDYAGNVLIPLDEREARKLAGVLRARQVESVAICFINAFANGVHEARMKEILEEEMPGVEIATSSETLPEIFEHERFSTTVVNAMLRPVVGRYVDRMGEELKKGGYESDLLLLHSGGGVMTPATAQKFAGRLAGSGIAAGAIASRHIAMLCGFENSIGLDMGGTSTDVSLTYGGELRVTQDWFIEWGYPIRFPSIEVKTIGAGGGSLAWIDEAGSLRNGPQSAGADPGPACYGLGNHQPTNTDANLVLGRLGTDLAGGKVSLDPAAAEDAVQRGVGEILGLSVLDAARAMLSVANANMADAVRLLSISRGYDPRDFALVAFGGAGALHGVELARELSIPTVIVPPNPGVTSALGCLLVDIRHDLAQSYIQPAASADSAEIERLFVELEAEANRRLEKEDVAPKDRILQRSIDMMYQGQWRSLQVNVNAPLDDLDAAIEDFHANHDREYAYRRDDTPVELYRLNLTAIGVTAMASLERHEAGGTPTPHTKRPVAFDGEFIETPIYRHRELPVGCVIQGPAIVEQLDSTAVVPPGVRAETDEWLNLRIRVTEDVR